MEDKLENIKEQTKKNLAVNEKITNKDVVNMTSVLIAASNMSIKHKFLRIFSNWGKWSALLFIMHSHFNNALMSKTDIALHVRGMSRDGSLKWIDMLLETKLLNKFHDPSLERDKRKFYLIPDRELIEEYIDFCKDRIILRAEFFEKFSVDDKTIDGDINHLLKKLQLEIE